MRYENAMKHTTANINTIVLIDLDNNVAVRDMIVIWIIFAFPANKANLFG